MSVKRYIPCLFAWIIQGLLTPLLAADLRSVPFEELVSTSDAICRMRLIKVEETATSGPSPTLDSQFRQVRNLRGDCPSEVSLRWSRVDMMDLDEVGAEWILFLTASGQEGSGSKQWKLALPPRGAWKIINLLVLDWQESSWFIVDPDSYLHLRGLPETLFSSGQFRGRYFASLQIDFTARIIRADTLEAWFANSAGN